MRLTDLPPEIFEFVADRLDPRDLVATRLVCRDLAAKSQRAFRRVHFTDKSFLLSSRDSLLASIAIARHPVFGPALRKVSLHIDTIKRPERLAMPGGFGDGGDWESYEQHETLFEDQGHFLVKNTELTFSGSTFGLGACVGTLLSSLARLNKVQELVVTDIPAAGIVPLGAKILTERLEQKATFGSFATQLLDQAISYLHWPTLDTFIMETTPWGLQPRFFPSSVLFNTTRTGRILASAHTHQLRRITLHVQNTLFATDPYMIAMFDSLRMNWGLEYLEVQMEHVGLFLGLTTYDSGTTEALFRPSEAFPTFVLLKELRLYGAETTLNRLISFIKRQPALQKFCIFRSAVRLEDLRWEDIVDEGDSESQAFTRVLGVNTTAGLISMA